MSLSQLQSDAEEFVKLTEGGQVEADRSREPPSLACTPSSQPVAGAAAKKSNEDKQGSGLPAQWARLHGGYSPTFATVETLPAGCYTLDVDQRDGSLFAVPALPSSGLLLELPEMRSEHVLKLVETFWDSEADYKHGNEFIHGGAAYRCGMMLFGPPGSGKSCTLKLVSQKLVERGGAVFYSDWGAEALSAFLGNFRRIEPDRKCVVILEDIDSLIQQRGESGYLQLLDGCLTIDNCMFIATTNYPERLDPRIYNRPGRFSHIVKIGLPGPEARRAYLNAVLKNKRDLEQLVELTHGFSIDHLSALVNAVYREKKDLIEEAARLRSLFRVPKAGPEGPTIGLGA